MTHAHRNPDHDCVEIDPAVCLSRIYRGEPGEPDALAGFVVAHDRQGFDVRCEGFVRVYPAVRPDGSSSPMWDMTGSLEGGDLTLSPSVLCRLGMGTDVPECGFHGWVRNGKWVMA